MSTPENSRIAPDNPFLESCKRGGALSRAFARPSGARGAFAGILMALKNARMNELAVDALGVEPMDRILEIGFGHGDTIAKLAARAWAGYVAGVDTSEVMVRQALRRNRVATREGRVDIRLAGVSRLPFVNGCFGKVVATNCFQFWPRPSEDLREVRRVLRSGGRLLLVLRMRHPWRKRLVAPGFTTEEIALVETMLDDAGFSELRAETTQAGREVVLLSGRA